MFYCYINPPPPPFFLLSIVYFIALVWIVVQASPQPVIYCSVSLMVNIVINVSSFFFFQVFFFSLFFKYKCMFCRCIIISESVTTLLCNEWKMLQGWSGAIQGRGIWPLFPSHCLALMEGSWRPEIYYLRQCLGVWKGAWAQQMHKGRLNKLIPF